ncbi:MAG: P-loop NTPase [Hyphomicrobiales bacterium]
MLQTLTAISPPGETRNIVELGLVSKIVITGERVYFAISIKPDRASEMEPMRAAAQDAVAALDGVQAVRVTLTAQSTGGAEPPTRPAPPSAQAPRPAPASILPEVGHVIAVASGKGGVGKSTTAVNLALAIAATGRRVGILDADIYGPSLPRLLGIQGRPKSTSERVLRPMRGHGVDVMSMGFLVDEETPMVWRGPMVISALTQLLRDVAWGALDVMVVDMPPGTGDVQLTLAQQVPLAGAVIVSTPQDLALIDARKGLNMFTKVDVPVLGIVENMSYFLCPKCGERADIFSHGGAAEEARRLGVDFLGEIPLDIRIRETSDSGIPIVVDQPDGPLAGAYKAIAGSVLARLEADGAGKSAPSIVIET